MDKYFSDWVSVIEGIKNDNTYKASWGRAILECIDNKEYHVLKDEIVIEEYFIAKKILKYYWNLNSFFKVTQGDFLVIEKVTKEINEKFFSKKKNKLPVWYNEIEAFLMRKQIEFEKLMRKLIKIMNANVAYRFLNTDQGKTKLYRLDIKNKVIRFKKEQIEILKSHSLILRELINAKWVLYLENFNRGPHFSRKVRDSENNTLKRPALRAYKNILVEQSNLNGVQDFYTGENIEYKRIKVVHVIPFNYTYSNDLWNLVLVEKSTKPKLMPTDSDIKKLKARNKELLKCLKLIESKEAIDLEYAIVNKLVDKCYIDKRG